MSVKRYDFSCYAFYDSARLDVQECEDGDYVIHSDYAALLARHNALREAVAWERECDEFEPFDTRLTPTQNGWLSRYAEAHRIKRAARAEVDRLIENETSADCKGEG